MLSLCSIVIPKGYLKETVDLMDIALEVKRPKKFSIESKVSVMLVLWEPQ